MLYLSLFYAGQIFMGFQWDVLLLETGFLALLLSIATRPGIWLLRWLLFRFMFLSGAVKLLSGDPTWHNLSALSYYFQTQPLPTPLAWYVHHLPQAVLTALTVATLVIELGLPFLIFCPRRLRFVAAFGIFVVAGLILLTGNYAFFNLLTMALCIVLFDDAALRKILPRRLTRFVHARPATLDREESLLSSSGAFAMLIVFVSLVQLHVVFGGQISAPAAWITSEISPLLIVNTYGLFAVMTTTRPEIIIEGSDDGVNWREYAFKYKPGDVMRRPRWNLPHQPRLDWQMWFAALGSATDNPWISIFLQRLLEDSPEVIALLGRQSVSRQAAALRAGSGLRLSLHQPAKKRKDWRMVGAPAGGSLLPRYVSTVELSWRGSSRNSSGKVAMNLALQLSHGELIGVRQPPCYAW